MSRRDALTARESAKSGLRGKINAFCISCIYEEGGGGGNWREQVEACTAPKCPLFPVRPVSSGTGRVSPENDYLSVKNGLPGPATEDTA